MNRLEIFTPFEHDGRSNIITINQDRTLLQKQSIFSDFTSSPDLSVVLNKWVIGKRPEDKVAWLIKVSNRHRSFFTKDTVLTPEIQAVDSQKAPTWRESFCNNMRHLNTSGVDDDGSYTCTAEIYVRALEHLGDLLDLDTKQPLESAGYLSDWYEHRYESLRRASEFIEEQPLRKDLMSQILNKYKRLISSIDPNEVTRVIHGDYRKEANVMTDGNRLFIIDLEQSYGNRDFFADVWKFGLFNYDGSLKVHSEPLSLLLNHLRSLDAFPESNVLEKLLSDDSFVRQRAMLIRGDLFLSYYFKTKVFNEIESLEKSYMILKDYNDLR